MKLELQLYGINVVATANGVMLLLNGTAVRFSASEFAALSHAFTSIQDLISRATPTAGGGESLGLALHQAAPQAVVLSPTGKKRGRPPKNPLAATTLPTAAVSAAPTATTTAPTTAKKRGRPPKNPQAIAAATAADAPAPRKRGRPPKNPQAIAAATAADATAPRKRGRPPKNPQAIAAATAADAPPPRKRGRPPKNPQAIAAATAADAPAPRKRGRPPKNPQAIVAAASADGAKRGPGRPRTDGTEVGAPRLVEVVDAWMAENPGPKSIAELTSAAEANGWVDAAHAAEYLERHVPRAPHLFVRLPDGRFRRRADKSAVEAPKAAKVMRRRGHDEIAIVRVEAPGT